jgi:preprotein translocase subunit SecG
MVIQAGSLVLWRFLVLPYLNVALIITSIALIISVVLQSKGAGLGGLTGADTGGIFTARRGIEKTLFRVTIVLGTIFFLLAIATVLVGRMS